jgi:hypothetical protein
MKAKKVYEFRTSGEIVSMGINSPQYKQIKIREWFKKYLPDVEWNFNLNLELLHIKTAFTIDDIKNTKFDKFPCEKVKIDSYIYIIKGFNLPTDYLEASNNIMFSSNSYTIDYSGFIPKVLKSKSIYFGEANIYEFDKSNIIANSVFIPKNIEKLHNNMKIRTLYGNQNKFIKEIPDFYNNFYSLDINNTNIEKLPDNLKVEYELNISNTLIEELPENLSAEILNIKYTNIKKIPESFSFTKPNYFGNKILISPNKIDELKELNPKFAKYMQMN